MSEIRYEELHFSSREEWLKARVIGGSSAASIIGKNPWQSNIELYWELIGQSKKKDADNEILKHGRKLEPLIRKALAVDFPNKYKVIEPKNYQMFRVIDKPFMTATIDGTLIETKTGRKGILEIKTHDMRNAEDISNWESGNLPPNYIAQVIHYLAVLNDYDFVLFVPKLNYYGYDGNVRKLTKTVTRYDFIIERKDVESKIAWLEKQVTEFYENHVAKRIPPQPSIKF